MEERNNELVIINDNTIEIFKKGKDIVLSHRKIVAGALAACENTIREYEAAFRIEDIGERRQALAKVDELANRLLVKLAARKGEMEDARKGLTQLFDDIRKLFTTEENKLDPKSNLPSTVQALRNKYSKWINDEKAKADKERQLILNKERERIEIKSKVNNIIAEFLMLKLSERVQRMTSKFNSITLENYDEISALLPNTITDFDRNILNELAVGRPSFFYLSMDEVDAIAGKTILDYDYGNFSTIYKNSVENRKHELINRLDSKKAELLEEKRLKELKDKEALNKLELDRKIREDEDRLKNTNETKQLQDDTKQKLEVQSAGELAGVLFNGTTAVHHAGPASKETFVINVKNHAGWHEIFELWYRLEGKDMYIDDLEPVTLGRMKKFCEKVAKDWKKTSKDKVVQKAILIESPNIEYSIATRAINKKEKVNEE